MSSPFPLPVMFTAWTWKDGAGIAGEVIRRAKLGGFKTVAVQLSQEGSDGGSSLDKVDIDYLHEAGLFVVGWDPVGADTTSQLAALPFDGWLPQVEGAGQRDELFSALSPVTITNLPKALVTTYGGLDTAADVANLRHFWPDVFAFVECYKADGYPHDDVSRMLAQGGVYGFDTTRLRAICGTYRGEMPSDYTGLTAANYGGIYLEENTNDAQLQAFAALTKEVTPVTLPDPAALNQQISKLAHSWLDPQLPTEHPLARLACIADISETDDTMWVARRQFVRAAIDGTAQDEMARLQDELAKAQTAYNDLNAKYVAETTLSNQLAAKIAAAQKDLAA